MFLDMKKSNLELFNSVISALEPNDLAKYKKLVNFDKLEKKQRVFVKVIGVKMTKNETSMDNQQNKPNKSEMNDSDYEQ